MSAIAGIYRLDRSPVSADHLCQMVDILAHRGPDGSDTWHDSHVGLGHRMLWSTPESLSEKLPLAKGELVITADARIDNRDELISALNLENPSAEAISDSELIVAAYEKWDEKCLDRLIGDFAFAIWDSRKQRMFCARDHFGVKPFYYFASESILVFATEAKALFCIEGVPRQLNRLRMGDYLLGMFHDTAMTSYQNIFRLPPAYRMIASASGVEIDSYWRLDPNRALPPASDQEYAAQLREIFTEAVRCRLRSAYPVGATLSGGLDSSSIACMARNLLKQEKQAPLHTFSSVFDSIPECDERSYTKPIFEQGGFAPHFVQGDHQTALENLDKMFWHQDEAFYAPNWFMNWPLYAEVQQQSVRVMLDGFDGDNAVSEGYNLLSELAASRRWTEFIVQSWKLSRVSDLPFWKGLWSYFYYYNFKQLVRQYWLLRGFQKVKTIFFPSRKKDKQVQGHELLNLQFSREMNMIARHHDWRKTQGHNGLSERQRQYRNLVEQGTESFALEVMDKMTAAFNIEPRYPFWDKRLIEFCLALPAEQKLYNGWTRVVMRRAMSGILPNEVQWRQGKTDFSPNLTRSLVNNSQELVEAWTSLDFAEEYIDRAALNDIHQRLTEAPSGQDARCLWLGLSLALWIRYFYRRDNQKEVPSSSLSNKQSKSKVNSQQVESLA
ncbi:MAG: lasso peptide isopeptide bond-forming cyclase [Cyanobacteria bacterium J06560_6]